jgi:hypothetical protein
MTSATDTADTAASDDTEPTAVDWKLAASSGLAACAVVGLFILAIKHAGSAGKTR